MDLPSPLRPDREAAASRGPSSAREAEIVAYYDALAARYDQDRFGNTYGAYLDGIERHVLRGLLQGTRVLDLACGTGRFLEFASEGLDLSPEMVRQARRKWPDKPIHLAPAWEIPVSDGCFDAVFSMHFFMHVPLETMRRVLQECRRVLRPRGMMIFDCPNALRRRLVGYRARGWHAATALSARDLRALCGREWRLLDRRGIALLPVHRLPRAMRATFAAVERPLGRTPLKHLASYHLVTLEKLD